MFWYVSHMGLIEFLQTNWAAVAAAPWVFVALVVFIGGGGFAAGRFISGERIATLNERITKRDETIADLEKRLSPTPVPHISLAPARHPDGVYQHGEQVGVVKKADLRLAEGTATFDAISSEGMFNQDQAFEYREWRLIVLQMASETSATLSGKHFRTIYQARCKILGKR
ncbi:hypothetical protein Amn_20050 [Aminobacter sp. Y103A]|nr:hypothetical protein Amn_20050 [Aminobacter sp. SS-2016]